MPPPHLHPRSRMTSSLFATTVFTSFFVVVLPHVLPCPAPRVALADGQMATDANGEPIARRRRRRRHQPDELAANAPIQPAGIPEVKRGEDGMAKFAMVEPNTKLADSQHIRRECPVPKPSGVIGELLGFRSNDAPSQQPQQPSRSSS